MLEEMTKKADQRRLIGSNTNGNSNGRSTNHNGYKEPMALPQYSRKHNK